MDTVLLVMMILVCFNYLLKQTYRKLYAVIFSATICALFVGLIWPYAIEQSKSQISQWLADTQLMLDLSVLLTLEVVIQMAFCLLSAHLQATGPLRRRTLWAYRLLRWFPGLLIFPVLFSFLVTTLFALPGLPFARVAWGLAVLVWILIPLLSWGLRQLLPEKDIRLEVLFLANALIAILGVIATVNGRTAVAGTHEVDLNALAGLLGLLLIGLITGSLRYPRQVKKQIKN